MALTCKICHKRSYGEYCSIHKPRKPIKRIRRPRQIGKQAVKWAEYRQQWIDDNPPDYRGYWQCYLINTPMCPRLIDIDQLTLDHIETRSSRPDLKYTSDNLKPCCIFCNSERGSKKYL